MINYVLLVETQYEILQYKQTLCCSKMEELHMGKSLDNLSHIILFYLVFNNVLLNLKKNGMQTA